MPHAKGVVLALAPLGKCRQTALGTDTHQLITPTCQHLVSVRLMTHVPHELIIRRVISGVQGDRQLHHAQICPKMPATLTDRVKQIFTEFVR